MEDWPRPLGPRTRFGALRGLGINHLVVGTIGGTLCLAVMSNVAPNSAADLPAGLGVGVLTGTVFAARYKGMPLANWALKALAYTTGHKRWAARAVGRDAEQLPRELGDVKIVTVRDRTSLVGMLREKKTLTGVARIELHSLGLFDTDEQGRRLDALRRILDDLARETDDRYRVQLLTKHVPRRANTAAAYVKAHVTEVDSPQVSSMLTVIENTASASHDDEFYLCVRQSVQRHQDQAAARIIERLRMTLDRLEQADIAVRATRSLLEPRELARMIKDAFDPFGGDARDELEVALSLPGADPTAAWPDARHRRVACYEADGAAHATLWIRGWPETGVYPGWLRPLTLSCDAPAMTVSTVLKPDDRAKALSRIRQKRSRGVSARLFRQRHGQMETSEHSSEEAYVDRLEREIGREGATPWWWEMYVTVSAPDAASLAETVRRAESACTECELTPVLLRFAQAEAFTFTLPLGRGLEPA